MCEARGGVGKRHAQEPSWAGRPVPRRMPCRRWMTCSPSPKRGRRPSKSSFISGSKPSESTLSLSRPRRRARQRRGSLRQGGWRGGGECGRESGEGGGDAPPRRRKSTTLLRESNIRENLEQLVTILRTKTLHSLSQAEPGWKRRRREKQVHLLYVPWEGPEITATVH